ncbi:MAG: DUF3078 domain-containing protein [bacterium]|nr:DUF3078 domain-containing protein [bacterium]
MTRSTLRWIPLVLLMALTVQAQDAAPPAAPASAWTHKLVGAVTANQVALKDGDNSFSWGYSLNGTSERVAGAMSWQTGYKFAFGQNKLGDQAIRKVVDKLEVETVLKWTSGSLLDPYLKATMKTQAFRGYQYTDALRTAVAGFFDPAYLTQSAGVGYQPTEQVTTRLGLALREIVTRDFNAYADDDGTTKIEKVRTDGGLESVTDASWKMADNIQLTSKLEIFVPITEPGDTAIGNDATLTVKLSEYITLNVNLEIVKDPTASDDVQIKQTTALGLRYNLF